MGLRLILLGLLLGGAQILPYHTVAQAPDETEAGKIVAEESNIGLQYSVEETHEVWITAYSSTPEETDDTPFITASGTKTRPGVMATNLLPFGTRVRVPKLFGSQIFIVEDRMHPRKVGFVDVWMPTKDDARQFGIHRTEIEVLAEI